MSVNDEIAYIEERFKEVSRLDDDFSQFPLTKDNHLQVATNKSKSDTFGEVFTPLWLVDAMISFVKNLVQRYDETAKTLDLCAGYGQFTIRLLRKYYKVKGEAFDLDTFMANHWLSELQPESCYKLIYIFGERLNLAIGDSSFLKTLPDNAHGFWEYTNGKWENHTEKTLKFYRRHKNKTFADYMALVNRKLSEKNNEN